MLPALTQVTDAEAIDVIDVTRTKRNLEVYISCYRKLQFEIFLEVGKEDTLI